jgi:hypothetical protein
MRQPDYWHQMACAALKSETQLPSYFKANCRFKFSPRAKAQAAQRGERRAVALVGLLQEKRGDGCGEQIEMFAGKRLQNKECSIGANCVCGGSSSCTLVVRAS